VVVVIVVAAQREQLLMLFCVFVVIIFTERITVGDNNYFDISCSLRCHPLRITTGTTGARTLWP